MRFLTLFLLLISAFANAAEQKPLKIVDPMQVPDYAQRQLKKALYKPVVVKKSKKTRKHYKELKLQSILLSKQRKVAIINDKLVSIGDWISGAKLIKINKNKVTLIRKGKVIGLSVNNQSKLKITPSKH